MASKEETTILLKLDSLLDSCERMEGKIDKLEKVIWIGNGTESLTVRMARMEEQVEEVKTDGTTSKKLKNGIILAVTTGVFGLLIALVNLVA